MNDKKKLVLLSHLRGLEKRNGRLLPGDVIKEARNPDSPLHREFQWDDTVAAHEYRLHQARRLISEIRVEVTNETRQIQTIAYIRDPRVVGNEPGYVRTERLRTKRELAIQALKAEAVRAQAQIDRLYMLADGLDLQDQVEFVRARFADFLRNVESLAA